MGEQPPAKPELDNLLRGFAPQGSVAARQSLASLESKLFGTRSQAVKLSRYVLGTRIAAGGGGIVYAAYDPKLDRHVAVKLLHGTGRDPARHEASRARLLREAQALAKLSHPNIVEVYDVGTYDAAEVQLPEADAQLAQTGPAPGIFVVMELVRGQNLADWLGAEGRTWREIREVFVAAGRGLAAAHARGLVHRDFKPANVLVGDDGRVRVLDFGLARALDAPEPTGEMPVEEDDLASGFQNRITITGTLLGTPAYMAPEQHGRMPTDARTDQYSFCLALFEGFYGKRPFQGEKVATLRRAKEAGVIGPAPRDSRVPSRLRAALLRGLQPNPGDRYPSMGALLADLTWDPRQRRRTMIVGGIALGTVAVFGLGYRRMVDARAEMCADAERLAGEVWGQQRGAALEAAFAASDVTYAADTWRRVAPRIQAYVGRWTAARRDACEATRIRGEQSPELMELRNACLDTRLRHTAALLDLLGDPDAVTIENAIDAAAELPELGPCHNVELLLAGTEPPSDPQIASAVGDARELVARATALRQLGQYERSLDVAREAVRSATEAGHEPVLAEAYLQLGAVQSALDQLPQAEISLGEALFRASARNHDEVAAAAAAELLVVASRRKGVFDEEQARHARATARRAGLEGLSDAILAGVVGETLAETRRSDEAAKELSHALELVEEVAPRHPRSVSWLVTLAQLNHKKGRDADATEYLLRATTVAEEAYGAMHPNSAEASRHLARLYETTGRLGQALALYSKALEIFVAAGVKDRRLGLVESGSGRIALQNGDAKRAVAHLRRALDSLADDTEALASTRFDLARALATQGRDPDRARGLATEARDTYVRLGDPGRVAQIERWLDTHGG